MAIEEDIISSHINEHEEAIAVAKRFSITKQEIGPLYTDNGSLTNDKKLICKLLLESLIVHSQYHYPIKW